MIRRLIALIKSWFIRPLTADTVHDVLLISVLDPHAHDEKAILAAIETWSDKDRQQVVEWAGAILLVASDNDDVIVPELPECITPWFNRHGHYVGRRP